MEMPNNRVNHVNLSFTSIGDNVSLARVVISSLAAGMDMKLGELEEMKVAVSEAVSNAIIHGYQNREDCWVTMEVTCDQQQIEIKIIDQGVGIADISQAMEANYTTDNERMGLGFSFMKSFMDQVEVISQLGKGTTVILIRRLTVASTTDTLVDTIVDNIEG